MRTALQEAAAIPFRPGPSHPAGSTRGPETSATQTEQTSFVGEKRDGLHVKP